MDENRPVQEQSNGQPEQPRLRESDVLRDELLFSSERYELLEIMLEKEHISAVHLPIISQNRESLEFPLSYGQQRLWFLDQFEPGNPFYNEPAAVRLKGLLHVSAFEQSLNEVIRRHEILRTTFLVKAGQPVQRIAPTLTLGLPVGDLRSIPANDREAKARELVRQEARHRFDLSRGPLIHVTLLQLDDQDYILVVVMHHIISDGWSMGVLIREVAVLYQAFAMQQPSPLPEPPIQYADFAVWQRQWFQSRAIERQLRYWKQQLKDAPAALDLPTDRPRPSVQTLDGATEMLVLSRYLTAGLKTLSQQEGITLFMTLLAAFQILLSRYTGQTDIVVGSPIANRTHAEIEGLIGFFVNVLALRTDLAGDPTVRELLSRVNTVCLEAYSQQDVPFEQLVEALRPKRELGYTPLFQVMFIHQNTPAATLMAPGLSIQPLAIDSGTAKFDLTLTTFDLPGELVVVFEYNTDLFHSGTIKRMLEHFQSLLTSIVADVDQRISAISLLTSSERQQLLTTWNNTQSDYPANRCINELFDAQVLRTPGAPAVICGQERLTYRDLQQRANQLAHFLQHLGVRPEVRVAICMDRSPALIV